MAEAEASDGYAITSEMVLLPFPESGSGQLPIRKNMTPPKGHQQIRHLIKVPSGRRHILPKAAPSAGMAAK